MTELGLVSFCKTTVGKGLHVVTPLAVPKSEKLSWDRTEGSAHDVCEQMARGNADLHLIKMAKNQGGRIFLDYLRKIARRRRWRRFRPERGSAPPCRCR
jgi:bifunctional non-homologous end joining protein LigD